MDKGSIKWATACGLLLGVGCSAGHDEGRQLPEELGEVQAAAVCNADDFQSVASYAPVDGVPKALIDQHAGAVGRCDQGAGSVVLLGDGLYLAPPGCGSPSFEYRERPDSPPTLLRYPIHWRAVEQTANYSIGRVRFSPQTQRGFAAIDTRIPEMDEKLALIGYPGGEGSQLKSVDVGRVASASATVINYKQMDTPSELKGSPVISAASERLVGVHQTDGTDAQCVQLGGGGAALPLREIARTSPIIDNGSGSLQVFRNVGTSAKPAFALSFVHRGLPNDVQQVLVDRFVSTQRDAVLTYDGKGVLQLYVASEGTDPEKTKLVAARETFALGRGWGAMTSADMDGDGLAELFALERQTGMLAALKLTKGGWLELWREHLGRFDEIVAIREYVPAGLPPGFTPGPTLVAYMHAPIPYLTSYSLFPSSTPHVDPLPEPDPSHRIGPFTHIFEVAVGTAEEIGFYDAGNGNAIMFSDGQFHTSDELSLPPDQAGVGAGLSDDGTTFFAGFSDRAGVWHFRGQLDVYNPASRQIFRRRGLSVGLGKILIGDLTGTSADELIFHDRFRSADPQCETGLVGRNACCPASCGRCGGNGCSDRPGGSACCINPIVDAGVRCTEAGPPCLMADPFCLTGIEHDGVCCPTGCGTCGGNGCANRPGGAAACCVNSIRDAAVSCSGSTPPCVVN